nr:8207_t:CDS:2 [Entrophospora candida]
MEHYSKEYIECKDIYVKVVSKLLKDIIHTTKNEHNDPNHRFAKYPTRFEYHLCNLEISHVPEIHMIHLAHRKELAKKAIKGVHY